MQMIRPVFAIAMLVAVGATARATEAVPPVSDVDPSCACVAKGKRYAQGETACINGLRMTCGMSQNITSWLGQGEQCQVSLRFTKAQRPLSVAAK